MLLQSLYQHGENHHVALPAGCTRKTPKGFILLTNDGQFIGIEPNNQPIICPSIIIREANEPVLLRPVEYKHGKLRNEREYEIQLCAQAMCLEEMYHCPRIEAGDIFYISSHRRKEITLDKTLP